MFDRAGGDGFDILPHVLGIGIADESRGDLAVGNGGQRQVLDRFPFDVQCARLAQASQT